MCQLRLFMVSLDRVRDYFGGEADRARLRAIAQERFRLDRGPRTGMLGKLGPLLAKPRLPVAAASELPTHHDVETLLAGHAVAPERRPFAWQVVSAWIYADAVSTLQHRLSWADLGDVDAAAVRAGLDPALTLEALFSHDPDLALPPPPHVRFGCLWTPRSLAMASAFAQLPASETQGTLLGEIGAWLATLPRYVEQARDAGERAPDLLAAFTCDELS